MDTQRFRSLSAHSRALVTMAVLLDGHEAGRVLSEDTVNGSGLERAADEIANQNPMLRMPFVGTSLRIALEELKVLFSKKG